MSKPTYDELLDALKRVTERTDWPAWQHALDLIHRASAPTHAVPYPQHCVHPWKCDGLTDCPRDPVCID